MRLLRPITLSVLVVLLGGGWYGGLSFLTDLRARAAEMKKKNKSLVILWMGGGPATIDLWDMKPDSPNGGEHKPKATAASGVSITEHLPTVAKLEEPATTDPVALRAALEASGEAMAELLRRGLADGRVKNFKPHPVAFLGYLLAHDAHHRGEIQLTLTQAGHKLSDKVGYGLWEWGVR